MSVGVTFEELMNGPSSINELPGMHGGWENVLSVVQTTSSTTASLADAAVPGHGLFPDVHEAGHAQSEETSFMQLTPAERTRLLEDGVPENIVVRLESYLESLQRQQDTDRGPEGRWALGRVHQRLQDAMEALDTLFEIVGRRLVHRGFWPVQRLPSSTTVRSNMYQWASHLGRMAVDLVEAHLRFPLQDSELNSVSQFLREPPAPVTSEGTHESTDHRDSWSESVEGAGLVASSSSSSGPVGTSRDRSRSPSVRVERNRACPSSDEGGGVGSLSFVPPEPAAVNNSTPSAALDVDLQYWLSDEMQAVLHGDLRGIWAEPDLDTTAASSSEGPVVRRSTSSTTTEAMADHDLEPVVLVQDTFSLHCWGMAYGRAPLPARAPLPLRAPNLTLYVMR